ncbi:MAG: coiled-coil protein [Candidatus Poseidoniaceae archaeon]
MDDFKQLFEERRSILDGKATQYREERDSWNEKTKELVSQRNEFNSEVRELIQLSDQQKQVREQMNQVVREKKGVRNEASQKVSEIRDRLRADQPEEKTAERGPRGRRDRPITLQSLQREFSRLEREFERGEHTGKNEGKVMKRLKELNANIRQMKKDQASSDNDSTEDEALKAARKEHDDAHQAVQEAASAAQEAHDLMIQWDKEVSKQRERANSKHRELRNTKQEADKAHRFYIVSLRCLHSIQDMMRARRSAEAGEGERPTARVEVQDLMSKLMSGDTLTTEELMELQRFD